MVYDILSQAADEIKSCPTGMFSIQLGESTNVVHLAQLSFTLGMFTMMT
jgi:hypothetical protein